MGNILTIAVLILAAGQAAERAGDTEAARALVLAAGQAAERRD